MSPILQIDGKKLVRALEKKGFFFVSQKGSHIKMARKENGAKTIVIVPNHKLVKPGTLRNVLKRSRITESELRELLKGK